MRYVTLIGGPHDGKVIEVSSMRDRIAYDPNKPRELTDDEKASMNLREIEYSYGYHSDGKEFWVHRSEKVWNTPRTLEP